MCVLVFCRLVVVKVLLGCKVTMVSKNRSVPCCDGSSTVNWMCGS